MVKVLEWKCRSGSVRVNVGGGSVGVNVGGESVRVEVLE